MTADAKTPRDVLAREISSLAGMTTEESADRAIAALTAASYQITPVQADDAVAWFWREKDTGKIGLCSSEKHRTDTAAHVDYEVFPVFAHPASVRADGGVRVDPFTSVGDSPAPHWAWCPIRLTWYDPTPTQALIDLVAEHGHRFASSDAVAGAGQPDDGVRVEVALRHALETLRHARVFVTSKEKIKHPEGTDLYDGTIKDIEIALVEAQTAAETRREAPASCPNCFNRSDCSSVDICNAVSGAGRDAEARDAASESWRPCGIGYEVSDAGHVRSIDRVDRDGNHRRGRVLQPYFKNGYLSVSIWDSNKRTEQYVHRLVADAFLIRDNDLQTQVNHRDGNRCNNVAANLEWCSNQENGLHARRVMPATTRAVIRTDLITGEKVVYRSLVEAEEDGFTRSLIQKCIAGERGHHKGYRWEDAIDAELAPTQGVTAGGVA